MSDELRELLLDYAAKSGAWNDNALENIDQALSAIRELIPRMVEIDKIKLLVIIQSCFKEPWDVKDIPRIVSRDLPDALCEQIGEIMKVKK